jgi:hypothetical protein
MYYTWIFGNSFWAMHAFPAGPFYNEKKKMFALLDVGHFWL